MVLDVVALSLIWYLVVSTVSSSAVQRLATTVGAVVVTVAVLAAQHLYDPRVWNAPARVVLAAVLGTLAAAGVDDVVGLEMSATPHVAAGAAAVVALALGRTIRAGWLRLHRASGRFTHPVVLVGGNEEAAALDQLIRVHPDLGYRVSGVLAPADDLVDDLRRPGLPWLGGFEDVPLAVAASGSMGVVVASTAVPYTVLQRITRELVTAGFEVQLSAGLNGVDHRRLRWQPIGREPLFHVHPQRRPAWQGVAKRVLDVVLASIGLVVSFPVMLVAALAVKLEDRGSVLFVHERVGVNGQPFRLYKLRTMVPDAEKRLVDIRKGNDRRGGPLFKLERDPRVTRVGRFLRASSLDEVPQLINVLQGRMSLVGPRPALPSEAAVFDDELRSRRLAVRPGVTGLWQVEARDNPEFAAYRRLDLFYVENWSIGFDLAILGMTIGQVLIRMAHLVRRPRRERLPRVLLVALGSSASLDRVRQQCQALVASGFGVSVICTPRPGDDLPNMGDSVRVDRYAGPRSASGPLALLRSFTWCLLRLVRLSVQIARRDGFNAVQVCPGSTMSWALAVLYKLGGKRVVLDQIDRHDVDPAADVSRLVRPTGLLPRAQHALERAGRKAVDQIITDGELRGAAMASPVPAAPHDIDHDIGGVAPGIAALAAADRVPPVPALRHGRRHLCVHLGGDPPDGGTGVLQAMRQLVDDGRTDVHLAVLGSAGRLEALRALASQLDVGPFVTFVDDPDADAIRAHLSTAAVGLSPLDQVPHRQVLRDALEYMAYELPVVAANRREVRVAAGDAAVYVPDGDARACAAAISELLDDDVRRRTMGRCGRQRIEAELSWVQQAPRYVEIYRSLLHPSRPDDGAASVGSSPLAGRPGVPWASVVTGGRAS